MKKASILIAIFIVMGFGLFSVYSAFAAELKEIEFRNGTIYFPESDVPEVDLSKLKFSYPQETPKEFLNLKGNLYKGRWSHPNDQKFGTMSGCTAYLIPIGYNAETKEISILQTAGQSNTTKPARFIISGIYDKSGSSLKYHKATPDKPVPTYNVHIIENKVRINMSNGASSDFVPVAKLP